MSSNGKTWVVAVVVLVCLTSTPAIAGATTYERRSVINLSQCSTAGFSNAPAASADHVNLTVQRTAPEGATMTISTDSGTSRTVYIDHANRTAGNRTQYTVSVNVSGLSADRLDVEFTNPCRSGYDLLVPGFVIVDTDGSATTSSPPERTSTTTEAAAAVRAPAAGGG